MKMLMKDLDKRYTDCKDLISDIDKVVREGFQMKKILTI